MHSWLVASGVWRCLICFAESVITGQSQMGFLDNLDVGRGYSRTGPTVASWPSVRLGNNRRKRKTNTIDQLALPS